MQPEARQRRIEEHLEKVEFASLEELAQQLGVSVSTVRRDVNALEAAGFIRRTHGGARLLDPRSDEFAFATRDSHQAAEKELIGRVCAALIAANQTVIVDAGSTCFHVARHLEGKTLHIVTNSLPVANHFGSSQRVEVVVSGGVIYPRLGVLVGPLAVEAFSKAHADVAVMSCGGIGPDGVTNSHGLLIDIQRAMMRAAQQVVLCVDHTKFGRQSMSRLCGLEEVDTLICDQAPPKELLEALQAAGVEVVLATEAGPEVISAGRVRSEKRKKVESRAEAEEEPAEGPEASPEGETGRKGASASGESRRTVQPSTAEDGFLD